MGVVEERNERDVEARKTGSAGYRGHRRHREAGHGKADRAGGTGVAALAAGVVVVGLLAVLVPRVPAVVMVVVPGRRQPEGHTGRHELGTHDEQRREDQGGESGGEAPEHRDHDIAKIVAACQTRRIN